MYMKPSCKKEDNEHFNACSSWKGLSNDSKHCPDVIEVGFSLHPAV